MQPRELRPGVWSVGAVDWDRRLFDELIPLPDGTSYNCYLVRGSEKTVLLDTVDPARRRTLLENLDKLKVGHIDYIVAHHAEQDHSGSLPAVLNRFPEARVLANEKCKRLLTDFMHLPEERFVVVKDGEELALGKDKSLQFISAPWVHWPETMLTYLKQDKILFSCDFLGSHFATSELTVSEDSRIYEAAKRYYAQIMMPFRTSVQKNLDRIADMAIDVVAPSHGPVYERPAFIIDAYRDWVSPRVRSEVVIAYVSMHGSTRTMVEYLTDALTRRGIPVRMQNLTVADVGELAMALVDAATLVVATPTVLAGPHPSAVYAAYLVNALRPKTRYIASIVSYGWGGKAAEKLRAMLDSLHAEIIDPVVVRGCPQDDDFQAIDKLADMILERHKSL